MTSRQSTGFSPARREALQQLLVDTVEQTARPRVSRRTKLVSAGAAGVVVLGGGAAVAYSQLSSSPVTDNDSARCYTVAVYTGSSNFPGTSIAEADSATRAGRVADALDVCAALWRAGLLQPGVPTVVAHPSRATYPVPNLVACVLPNGKAAVFPGAAGTCAKLGLPAADTPN